MLNLVMFKDKPEIICLFKLILFFFCLLVLIKLKLRAACEW